MRTIYAKIRLFLEKRKAWHQATKERGKGGHIHIIANVPTIAIRLHTGQEFWLDEAQAQELLNKVPKGIAQEDWLLYQALSGQFKGMGVFKK